MDLNFYKLLEELPNTEDYGIVVLLASAFGIPGLTGVWWLFKYLISPLFTIYKHCKTLKLSKSETIKAMLQSLSNKAEKIKETSQIENPQQTTKKKKKKKK